MSTVSLLLATKLYRPPPRSGLVPRLRRTARLSEGLAKPLTLVAAPTGFGKTTVVSEWIAGGQPSPIAWVSLDEDDNDPTRFFTYLAAALQNLQSDIGETALALLQSTPPSSPKTVLTALINDLSQDDPSPMTKVGDRPHVLVLDDYHVITTPPIQECAQSPTLGWPGLWEWLEDVFIALKLKAVTIIGLSQGAWTGLKFAVYQPERVKALAVLSPGGITPDKPSFVVRALPLLLLGRWGIRRINRADLPRF